MSQDKRTIGDNPANINPIQKIWNHIKYRKGFGTPDFQEGFLGISTMGWFWHQHRIHRIVDTFKWKYRAIKERTKTLAACTQSWKIPKVIEQFQDAMYQAERDLNEQYDKNSNLEEQLESAVEDIIEARHDCYHSVIGKNIFSRKRGVKFLDVSHKDYEEDLESIRDLYEGYGLRLPNGFLSEKKAEDRMWNDFDNSRCEAADFGPDDFDFFRYQIDKSFYDSSKVWNEEILPKLEKEKKYRAETPIDHWCNDGREEPNDC